VKKNISFEDLETLLRDLKDKKNFTYNNINHSAMVASDGKVIIRNWQTGVSVGRKQFLSNFFNETYTPKVEIENHTETVQISNSDYKKCFITPPTLSMEFLEYLQIEEFRAEYENHKNISLFDFDKLRELHPTLKLFSKKNILFSNIEENYNISVKWNSSKGWQSIKGTKGALGAFLKAEKQTSTLILCEGLKDGINANIAFPTADILSTNGKSNSYNFSAWNIDLNDYRYIVFANDRDAESELIKMFPPQHKEHFKKTKYIDWKNIKDGKDITDFIQSDIVPTLKTKRDRTRKALTLLKKVLHKNSFETEYSKLRATEAQKTVKTAIESDNKQMVMRAIKTLNMFNGDMTEAVKYYLKKQNETKSDNNLIIPLGADNRLSTHTDKIVATLDATGKLFLNAPTGTGKSYTSLTELPKKYKNIIIVSPLRMVTNEHGAENTPYTNVQFNDKFEAVQADLNSNYIAVTTDAFVKLQARYNESFKQRLQNADLIIFDEQHLYYDSLGFRDETVVKCYEYLLYQYQGKTLFMSGTPILPKDIKVSLITAKVLEENKEQINLYYNPFDDTKQIIESINKELIKGAVLIYVNSRAKVAELQNLLQSSDIKTLSITSHSYKLNSETVDDTILNQDLGNIVYISTTKATTGVNFKHLKAIYQYGTPYTPNTFIQLVARLRSGGKYFIIEPQFAQLKEQYNAKRAIGLSLAFQKQQIAKLSDAYNSDTFQKWLKNFVLLSHNNKNLQGFFKTYSKAFQLIEAKGLGKFNETNDNFIFSGHNVKNISDLFHLDDENEFRKFIEQIIIDWTVKNDVELLNEYYNLSYRITNATYKISESKHQLITDIDKEQKREDRKEIKDEIKELHKKIDEKFEDVEITAKYLKKNNFSDTELSKLNDIKIYIDKIKDIKDKRDKATALKFHLIPISAIFKTAHELIIKKNHIAVKELDSMLQHIFITNARKKHPYESLLLDTFTSEIFNNSYLKFTKSKRVDKKLIYNILEVSKEHKSEFKQLKSKREKEYFLKEQLRLQEQKMEAQIKKYGSDIEVVFEDKTPTQKVPTQAELKRTIADENIPLNTRAKAMQELAKNEEKNSQK
jgi:hypothetical protein